MRTLRKAVLHILPDGAVQAEVLPEGVTELGCHGEAGCDVNAPKDPRKAGCAGCAGCAGGGGTPGAGLLVTLAGVSGRREGEIVDIWLDSPGQTVLALTLLGLPLLLALTGGVLGNNYLGESWLALTGAAGLALGFAVVWLMSKTLFKITATLAQDNL